MTRLAAIILAACVLTIPAHAQTAAGRGDAIPKFKPRTLYGIARVALLKTHARPVPSAPGSYYCEREADICRAYPELDSCSEGLHFCNFQWLTASGRRFTITTAGELVEGLEVQ